MSLFKPVNTTNRPPIQYALESTDSQNRSKARSKAHSYSPLCPPFLTVHRLFGLISPDGLVRPNSPFGLDTI